ncbi:MAG: purine-nucleoside phosphorylase [Thermotogaceae bacterium]|nr:purine-nucleoside phosphorylase [Thermotogaceae bacterium]
MKRIQSKIKDSLECIKNHIGFLPEVEVGLILGSGLGEMADEIENKVSVPYDKIKGFLKPTIEGHKGNLVFGKLESRNVCIMQGRFHYYEGNKIEDIVYPLYVMKELGATNLIVTNAAGGINMSFEPGDLVIIDDCINFAFKNPPVDFSMKPVVFKDEDWINRIDRRFKDLKKGTYIFVTGPSYETPSEIRAFRKLGADMVGMSTVPEIIVAGYLGLKVLGISCITNMAAGILSQPLSHEEVIEVSRKVKEKFKELIKVAISEV